MESTSLSVFLPWSVYGLLEEAAGGRTPRRTCQGTVLFCDVAGFTPLTEALSVLGREGSEELTRLLNAYFTRMIGILAEEGGDVLRFGGDAMTVFFPGESREQAARGALRMMAAMEEFAALPTRAGTFTLSMKIGAACGPVHLGLLGSAETGWDYYAAGAPLDASADAEHHSAPGRIVVHPTFAQEAPRTLALDPMEGGYARLVEAGGRTLSLHPPAPPPEARLREFVPRHLAERAGAGSAGEHRGTAVVFLSFTGLGWEDPAGAHARLEALFTKLATTARRYGGSLNKVDFGDKGAKALLLFGVPYACEQKEEMAARAALDLLRPGELPAGLSTRAGLTAAPLFSGPVGSPGRREFTVMGDGINLAARLMAACQAGQALASKEVASACGATLRFAELPPVQVKGKREPVPLFQPLGTADRDEPGGGPQASLVEREEACAALRGCLFGSGLPPVALVGGPGMGKTALVEWARREALLRGLPTTRVILAPYSAERPFVAWRGAVRAATGLGKEDAAARVREARDAALADEMPGYRPLLNPLFGLPEEITPAVRNLSPKERKDLTLALAGRLLASFDERVVLMDNLQWADPLSLDLLSFVLPEAAAAPWRLAVSLRPGVPRADQLAALMGRVELAGLSGEGLSRLLAEAHGLTDLTPAVREWFTARSRGNPSLAGALVGALERGGLIARGPSGATVDADRLLDTAFPDTLEGLYLAQVDGLPQAQREVLQRAAILGGSVSVNLLLEASGFERGALETALAGLTRAGLLFPDTWGERPYLRFADPLLRDAVYAALPYALRREGHARVGAVLEPEGRENPRLWPTLAHHFEQASDAGRARTYHRLAGRDAVARFDNASALPHLEFVCRELTPAAEEAEDAFSLLDVCGTLGRWEESESLLARLTPLREALGAAQRARLAYFRARSLWRAQRWEEAERELLAGLALYREEGDVSGQGKTFVNLVGGIYGPTGQLDKARASLERALKLPKGPGQESWRTTAGMNLGVVLWYLGEIRGAERALADSYRAAHRLGMGPLRGMVADNLCGLLLEQGRFEEAAAWGSRAVEALETFALRGVTLNARYNLAMAQLSAGRISGVRDSLLEVRRRAQAQGNRVVEGRAAQGAFQAALWEGDLSAAFALIGAALDTFRQTRNARDFRMSLLQATHLLHTLGALDQARRLWRSCGAATFLRDTPGDPVADRGLARESAWMEGRPAVERVDPAAAVTPEEELERLLEDCEGHLTQGRRGAVRSRLRTARKRIAEWPYYEARLRVALFERLAGKVETADSRREAGRLLGACTGGIWGLRLLCLLWAREKDRARSRALRRRGLARLYHLRAHSPDWAWERILALPEILPLLRGSR